MYEVQIKSGCKRRALQRLLHRRERQKEIPAEAALAARIQFAIADGMPHEEAYTGESAEACGHDEKTRARPKMACHQREHTESIIPIVQLLSYWDDMDGFAILLTTPL